MIMSCIQKPTVDRFAEESFGRSFIHVEGAIQVRLSETLDHVDSVLKESFSTFISSRHVVLPFASLQGLDFVWA